MFPLFSFSFLPFSVHVPTFLFFFVQLLAFSSDAYHLFPLYIVYLLSLWLLILAVHLDT